MRKLTIHGRLPSRMPKDTHGETQGGIEGVLIQNDSRSGVDVLPYVWNVMQKYFFR